MEAKKEVFYLTMHSTVFINSFYMQVSIYRYMASDIIMGKSHTVRKETRCRHLMGYSFRLAVKDILYAPSHRQTVHTTTFVKPVVQHWMER